MNRIINGAVDRLHEVGWTRGKNIDNIGRVCVNGALGWAAMRLLGEVPQESHRLHYQQCHAIILEYERARDAVLQVLHDTCRISPYSSSIELWNDRNAKDIDEVLEVLKLANEIDGLRELPRWHRLFSAFRS